MGGHPLRSPTRHRLGKPLPYQLADGTQAPPEAIFTFTNDVSILACTCGISRPFGLLSHSSGQVTNALLTRSPLIGLLLSVRLACIKHAASVHPEPGSNSPQNLFLPCGITSLQMSVPNQLKKITGSRLPITLQLLRCRPRRPDKKPMPLSVCAVILSIPLTVGTGPSSRRSSRGVALPLLAVRAVAPTRSRCLRGWVFYRISLICQGLSFFRSARFSLAPPTRLSDMFVFQGNEAGFYIPPLPLSRVLLHPISTRFFVLLCSLGAGLGAAACLKSLCIWL